jgi:hypothetical protein
MSERWLTIGAWAAFVVVIAVAAHLVLAACDLGSHPLFGLTYCRAEAVPAPMVAERDRERNLLDRLHETQVNLSRLPVCLPNPPRREPERRADNVPPPQPPPPPQPERRAESPAATPPSPAPDDRLTVPRNLNDLNGCWQSVRGDLNMVSDDAEERPLGTMRICYCLGSDGRGTTRYIFQDGGRCIGPLRAQISQDRLTMKHATIKCTGKANLDHVVPTDIICSNKAGEDTASCDSYSHGDTPSSSLGEKYHRVSFEYCN